MDLTKEDLENDSHPFGTRRFLGLGNKCRQKKTIEFRKKNVNDHPTHLQALIVK